MRILAFAALAAATIVPATAASAQNWRGGYNGYGRNSEVRAEQRECRRELRRADSRREYQHELRECRREIREAQREDRRDWRDSRRYRSGHSYGGYRRY